MPHEEPAVDYIGLCIERNREEWTEMDTATATAGDGTEVCYTRR